jgi:hypothetical protein
MVGASNRKKTLPHDEDEVKLPHGGDGMDSGVIRKDFSTPSICYMICSTQRATTVA